MKRRRGKFRAIKTVVGENVYDSKLEARVAAALEGELRDGETLATQVAVRFACGAMYICDFAIADANGEIVRWVEAKGVEMPVWRLKLRLLKHERPDIYSRLEVITSKGRKVLK